MERGSMLVHFAFLRWIATAFRRGDPWVARPPQRPSLGTRESRRYRWQYGILVITASWPGRGNSPSPGPVS